jgi:soluble lytic murein transglycosylase-like protein
MAPQYFQEPEIPKENPTVSELMGTHLHEHSEVHARLNLQAPSIKPPDFQPVEVPEVIINDDGITKADVKSPTVVSIERSNGSLKESRAAQVSTVHSMVQDAGRRFGVDPVLGMAVVAKESDFNARAVSSDGHESKGLFQLLDRTGKELLQRFGVEREYNPFDPEQNVYLGVGYLRHLHDIFSKNTPLTRSDVTVAAANTASLEKLAVAAFNAGEGRVASAQQRALRAGKDPSQYDHVVDYLPESTQQYVARVIEAKTQFGPRLSAENKLR